MTNFLILENVFTILILSLTTYGDESRIGTENMRCYDCMDVLILESERDSETLVTPLRQRIVDNSYNGSDPGFCDNPNVITCPHPDEVCITTVVIFTGIYDGINGRAEVKACRCISEREWHIIHVPRQDICLPFREIFNMSVVPGIVGANLTNTDGFSCVCHEHECNYETGVLQCISCKHIQANFGDVRVNQQMETRVLPYMFRKDTPWCAAPKQVWCGMREKCVTLSVIITGNFHNTSGNLTVRHHRCLQSHQVALLEKAGATTTRECQPVTERMMKALYRETPFSPFSSASGVEGSLCYCSQPVCNLPVRDLPTGQADSGAGTRAWSVLLILLLVASILELY